MKSSTSPPYLPDDTWEEILTRLPVDSVHRFKSVSKRYLSIISHPAFIRRYIDYRATNFPQQLEHYLHYWFYYDSHGDGGFLELKLPNETPQPQLLSSPNLLPSISYDFDYLPIMRDCPRDMALQEDYCLSECNVISTSHGLALCRADLITYRRYHYPRVYYVCNPLTRQWVELPHSSTRSPGPLALACHPKPNSVNEVDFTVLEVEGEYRNYKDGHFYTHVFSSVTGCWSEHKVDCPNDNLYWHSRNSMVFYNGMFYWYAEVCVVAYDPINCPNKCNFINLPPDSPKHLDDSFLYHCQGKLLIGTTYPKRCVVWELTDSVKGKWDFVYDFPLSDYNVVFFSQFNKEIVCLQCVTRGELVLYNMKNCSIECLITFPSDIINMPVLMYKIPFNVSSWPTHVPLLLPKVRDE